MNAWKRNMASIERLLDEGKVETVQPASFEWALEQLDVSAQHLESARAIDRSRDPGGAFTLAYDAARKVAAVLLEVQGLRARADGSHATLAEAANEQFDGPFQHLNRYRRIRNTVEYPTPQDAAADADDVEAILKDAAAMIDAAQKLLDNGQPTPWRH